MKKLIFLITGLVLILSFSTCNNEADSSQGTTLVCFGDSLTAGYNGKFSMDIPLQSYPAYLQNKVSIPVVNAGISGDTSAQALARIEADVRSKDPQIAVILLGFNDIMALVPTENTEANLQEIISRLDNGKRKIYLAKFYTHEIAMEIGRMNGLSDLVILGLILDNDAMFSGLASANNVTLIENIWEGIWGEHMSDAVHPDKDGYEIMSNIIFNELEPYLKAHGLIKK